jgi:ATP-dependent Clp protease adaptor protein ClpS
MATAEPEHTTRITPAPAVAAPKIGSPKVGTLTLEKEEEKTLPAGLMPWKTICWDDPVHTMEGVVLLFMRLFGFPKTLATKKMLEVHLQGRSIVYTGPKEQAEYYAEMLGKAGMTNTIEPA